MRKYFEEAEEGEKFRTIGLVTGNLSLYVYQKDTQVDHNAIIVEPASIRGLEAWISDSQRIETKLEVENGSFGEK